MSTRSARVVFMSIVAVVLITGCTPLVDTSFERTQSRVPQSDSSQSELSRGEKIARAYEKARQAAQNKPAEVPSEDVPHRATAKHPRCESVAWIRYGSESDRIPGGATLVGEPVDSGHIDGAAGDVQVDDAGHPSTYVVAEGDMLDNIAARFCIENWDLASLNDLARETAVLRIGQVLALRPPSTG